MKYDIDTFMSRMEEELNTDIISKIMKHVFRAHNLEVIKRQAHTKKKLIISLKKFFNIIYYDNNFIVYMNTNNNVVMENTHAMNVSTYLYSSAAPENHEIQADDGMQMIANSVSNTQNNLLQTANFDSEDTNDVILFNNSNNQYTDYDGNTVQKKINFHVVYI